MKLLKIGLLFFLLFTFAQEKTNTTLYHLENRKGKLFIGVGSEYRITPIYKFQEISDGIGVITSEDIQNSGYAFNYNLSYFVLKNLSLNFEHSIRQDLLLFNDDTSFDYGARNSEKAIIMDYNFYLDYYFTISKKSQIFVRIGQSLMNRGTDYSRTDAYYDANGNLIGHSIGQENFNFEPSIYAIGYNRDKLNILLGVYTAAETRYFDYTNRFTIPIY